MSEQETIKVKRTYKEVDDSGNPTGVEEVYEGEFSYSWPTEPGEDYTAQFENEKAMWEHQLSALQTEIKQIAGQYILKNRGIDGLQEYMDDAIVGLR